MMTPILVIMSRDAFHAFLNAHSKTIVKVFQSLVLAVNWSQLLVLLSQLLVLSLKPPGLCRCLAEFERTSVQLDLRLLKLFPQLVLCLRVTCSHAFLFELHQTVAQHLQLMIALLALVVLLLQCCVQLINIGLVLPFDLLNALENIGVTRVIV